MDKMLVVECGGCTYRLAEVESSMITSLRLHKWALVLSTDVLVCGECRTGVHAERRAEPDDPRLTERVMNAVERQGD